MKKNLIIKSVIGIVITAIFIAVIIYANKDRPTFTVTEDSGVEYETAKVLKVLEDNTVVDESFENVLKGSSELQVEILTGRYKGSQSVVTNYFSTLYNVDVKEGDTVSVRIDTSGEGEYTVSVYNYNRIPIVIGLILLFFIALAVVGGKQGIKAFIGLAYTCVCLFFILLPLVLKGWSPIPLTCLIIFVTSIFCFLLIGGVQTKTISAAIGTMCGVIMAALLGQIAARLAGVSTFQTDEGEALMLIKSTFEVNLRGLFTSGIIIAATGAVMDIAMSIASALDEIYAADSKLTWKQLFKSGMNIGKDAMGTMSNTLVLAYVGSSLNMMVLIYSYGVSFTQLINTDFVAIELIRAIAGSIGIIGTVPCVALISAVLLTRKNKQ